MSDPIPLAGVLGHPVSHSKSPRLHGHWLRRYGLRGHYVPLEVTAKALPHVLRAMPDMGFVGANVTVPYKEEVLRLCDLVTDRAALIGAVNTLIFRPDGRLHGDNTDGYGFMSNIRQSVPDWQSNKGPAVVLGAGGASRAVIVALLEAGVPTIRLFNRTKPRAEALRTEFGIRVEVGDWAQIGKGLEGAALVVNTTSLGMTGQPPLVMPYEKLEPATVVTDIVYSPLETELLQQARARGCTTVDGLGMLLHQAVPGFERWFGHRPEVDEALRKAVLL